MQVIEQKYRPIKKNPKRYSFVECSIFNEASLETCVQCEHNIKINFDTVHCGYEDKKNEKID